MYSHPISLLVYTSKKHCSQAQKKREKDVQHITSAFLSSSASTSLYVRALRQVREFMDDIQGQSGAWPEIPPSPSQRQKNMLEWATILISSYKSDIRGNI